MHYPLVISDLDEALALKPDEGAGWLAFGDPRYEAFNGMFGGWTAAILLKAIQQTSDADATPSAITVNFFSPIPAGANLAIQPRRLSAGRAIEHWQATVAVKGDESALAHAMVILTRRRPTIGHTQPKMPSAPDPTTLPLRHPPNNAGRRTEIRPVHGLPPFGRMDTSSLHWTRETSGRMLDHVQLTFLADSYAPRSFHWSDAPGLSATITLSVYFHATSEEIRVLGDDYVLTEAIGTRGVDSTSGQQARLWSRSGALLVTTEQLAWYR